MITYNRVITISLITLALTAKSSILISSETNYFHPLPPPVQKTPARLALWQLPDARLRYDQACFLTAHNAFANIHDGWYWHAMQTLTIKEQLQRGIRGLMLDVYDYSNQIVLCHGSCAPWGLLQQSITKALKLALANVASLIITPREEPVFHKQLKDTLLEIMEWLEKNPKEVVTLFFENYVDLKKLDKYIKSIKNSQDKSFASLLLRRQIWDPSKHDGKWPILEQLINVNKRLIIFVENKTASDVLPKEFFGFPQWDYIVESHYGTFEHDKICEERRESKPFKNKPRRLYLLNLFKWGTFWQSEHAAEELLPKPEDPHQTAQYITVGLDYTEAMEEAAFQNSRPNIQKVIATCRKSGLANKRYPNFIALDFVDKGTAMQVVNILNQDAVQTIKSS